MNQLANRHINDNTAEIEGSLKTLILEEIYIFGVGLILIGSHGNGVFASFLLNSANPMGDENVV